MLLVLTIAVVLCACLVLAACGDKPTDDTPNGVVEDHVHAFGEWATTKPATCTTDGKETRTCACGETETRTVASTGHQGEWLMACEPTCTATGTRYRLCTVCDQMQYETLLAKGHQGEWIVTKEATCTEPGHRERVCTVCAKTIEEDIEALSHTFGGWQIIKEGGCGVGYKAHTCSVCQKQEIAYIPNDPTKQHVYGDDHVCTVCGEHEATAGLEYNITTLGNLGKIFGSFYVEVFSAIFDGDVTDQTAIAIFRRCNTDDDEIYVPSVFAGAMVYTLDGAMQCNASSVTVYGFLAVWDSANLETINFAVPVADVGNCARLTTINLIPNTTRCSVYSCSALTEINLPSSLEEITIQDCCNLTDIYYQGIMEQWERIQKVDGWDEGTDNYTIHCTNGDIAKE